MQENIDPKFWERKLKEEGLSVKRGDPEKVPVEAIEKDNILKQVDENTLKSFSLLSSEMQSNIISYIKEQRTVGLDTKTALEKLREVVEKSILLEDMDSEDNDSKNKPEKKSEVEPEIEELIVESIDELIRKLEEMRSDKNIKEKNIGWIN